jgi:hypothetical protein
VKNLTWQNPEQLFVAQELINKVKSKCCGIKVYHIGLYGFRKLIVYVIKDNGDNTSIVSLNKDGSFPKHV